MVYHLPWSSCLVLGAHHTHRYGTPLFAVLSTLMRRLWRARCSPTHTFVYHLLTIVFCRVNCEHKADVLLPCSVAAVVDFVDRRLFTHHASTLASILPPVFILYYNDNEKLLISSPYCSRLLSLTDSVGKHSYHLIRFLHICMFTHFKLTYGATLAFLCVADLMIITVWLFIIHHLHLLFGYIAL